MDKLTKAHYQSLIMYLIFPCLAVLLTVLCAKFFCIWLPFSLFGFIALLGFPTSAFLRYQLWKQRYELFPNETLDSRKAKITFGAIPVEILVWLIAMGILLSQK